MLPCKTSQRTCEIFLEMSEYHETPPSAVPNAPATTEPAPRGDSSRPGEHGSSAPSVRGGRGRGGDGGGGGGGGGGRGRGRGTTGGRKHKNMGRNEYKLVASLHTHTPCLRRAVVVEKVCLTAGIKTKTTTDRNGQRLALVVEPLALDGRKASGRMMPVKRKSGNRSAK